MWGRLGERAEATGRLARILARTSEVAPALHVRHVQRALGLVVHAEDHRRVLVTAQCGRTFRFIHVPVVRRVLIERARLSVDGVPLFDPEQAEAAWRAAAEGFVRLMVAHTPYTETQSRES